MSLRYGFDAVGNLTTLQQADQTTTLAQYGYDGLNRLTQVMDGPTGTPIETYTYDATGNRTALTNAGNTTAYSYPIDSLILPPNFGHSAKQRWPARTALG